MMTGWRCCCGLYDDAGIALLTREVDIDDEDEDEDCGDDFFMKWDSLLIFKGGGSNPLVFLLLVEVISLFEWKFEGLMTFGFEER